MRRYFLAIDGMSSSATDDDLFHFCPLQEVQPVIEAFPDADVKGYSGYFVVAEFSLWAHAYAIRLSTNEDCPVAVVAGDAPVLVASSFSRFLEQYLHDPPSLFPDVLKSPR
jgi:hypothetical protein